MTNDWWAKQLRLWYRDQEIKEQAKTVIVPPASTPTPPPTSPDVDRNETEDWGKRGIQKK